MKISGDTVVSLSYKLHLDDKDGEIVENVGADRPFMFMFGTEPLLPGFERNIKGLEKGDNFEFLLQCEEAYGLAVDEALVEIPKTVFLSDGQIDHEMLVEGNAIPMIDSDGKRVNGVVVEVKDDTVVMDFNHPLSGYDLFFSGTVLDVREATDEEMYRQCVQSNCSTSCCGGCNGGGDGGCK